jgi:tetratricopeptide (TPR) repeat protein
MESFIKNHSSYLVMILLVLFALFQGCASKKYAKQAQKLENAGLYEMAAENYLRSFNANKKNVDAATGLRRTGQRTLDMKTNAVNQAYLSGNDRETVYSYLEAMAYHQRIRNTGIDLTISSQARSFYDEARPRFLDRSFDEARLLLEEENFRQAEAIFTEIKRIDPSYQDLSLYMKISRSEPLYRQGTDQMNSGFYRKAYHTFTIILSEHGAYKDTRELRDEALEKGMITVAIADFPNSSRNRNAHVSLKSQITANISNNNNPFIRVVDDRNTEVFLREQEQASMIGSELKVGRLMAARAMLTGNLLTFDVQEGRLQRTERKAFLKEVITTEHPVTKEKSTNTIYHKVTYNEYHRENKAAGSFQYQLSSTETGEVLLSGVVNLNPSDQIHYAVFEGKSDNLVPGHWEFKDRDSAKDKIQDESVHVRNLQRLVSARQTIKSADELRNELITGIANAVSKAVNEFNPE